MLTPRRQTFTLSRRATGAGLYRLPNKITRFLCIGLLVGIILFISALVHAGVAENHRILKGELPARPSGPNAWESFNFLTRYYGGIRTLTPFEDNIPQYPRSEDEAPFTGDEPGPAFYSGSQEPTDAALPPSKSFPSDYQNTILRAQKVNECFLDTEQKVKVPYIRYYDGRPAGFPQNVLGSYELLSLPEDICFERHGRLGPYGFGYSVRSGGLGIGEHGDRDGSEHVWDATHQVDWRNIDWSAVQRSCYQANADLYKPLTRRQHPPRGFYINEKLENMTLFRRDDGMPAIGEAMSPVPEDAAAKPAGELSRTAIVIRCWDEYDWRAEDVVYLRSIITELSLASGGRYDVHLLVQVKNDAKYPIWADDEVYEQRIKDTVPKELQNIVTLWTETQMLSLYQGIHDLWTRGKDLPVHGVYRGLQMAMQYFAYNHPEYDYFWQWEMDIRYTGHYLDMFTKMENWAKEQPRKGLWERNARFYIPVEHGTWEDFSQMARVQAEMGTTSADNIWSGLDKKKKPKKPQELTRGEKMIWGPVRPSDASDWFEPENDPVPPTTYEHDKYQWGVGEEADLITLNPMFDPEGTTWLLADDITGYNHTDEAGKPPRRAQIITASRMSRRMLLTMHRETAFKKHHAFPEMWPATVALQHGYKAVFVPHPLYVDREWPTQYMAAVYNGGKNGASGGSRTSVFGQREHNLQGLTWFYNSGFAPNLYRRWLGLKVNNDGGEEFELTRDMTKDETSVGEMRGGEGRMCLPPMLIHPVKGVDLPVEQYDEIEVPESDPSA
ncbi:hypothetical protein M406DRAFT_43006 [Cryphonectria parasitica EP155]|uniref:Major facilitator superfamily transporter n=1 Tax=Cryphonectria parasitica (strain ATCC 38755 / EP155) TaxID=660469 RepID=A0A9P4Y1E6_CRYP1|nr:uncharacterized protein M406DRAFT_43006 [Cryphonectria parasitica EP155]KAF3764806.1 hypothetical protein M406DRAFT_43006 [Cryphonectria parasitica EP155]